MKFKQAIKGLVDVRPFSWVLIGARAIINAEREMVKPGTNDSIQQMRTRQWFQDNGDHTLRLNYDLNPESIVIDIGGYNGDYASSMFNKYNCNIYVFEPIPSFFNIIQDRFSHNKKVHAFCVGLAAASGEQHISMSANASSIFIKDDHSIPIQLKSMVEFLDEEKIAKVDLVKINIEGAEYDLLESLIATSKIISFKNIQIQFHDFVIPDAKERMLKIQTDLAKTHFLTYHYEFVWENWQLKES